MKIMSRFTFTFAKAHRMKMQLKSGLKMSRVWNTIKAEFPLKI